MSLKIFTPTAWKPTTVGNNAISFWGCLWAMLSAQRQWSLTFPDAKTMRFEVRPGDTFQWDSANADAANRSEVQAKNPDGSDVIVPNGTPLLISYDMLIEPGETNSSYFCALGQFHQDTDTNNAPWGPIFDIALASQCDVMTVDAKHDGADSQPVSLNLFTDAAPLVRGHLYHMEIKACADPTGKTGRLVVTRDGVTLLDYAGPLGYASSKGGYWKLGIYRGANRTQTMAVRYSAFSMVIDDKVQFPARSAFIPAPVMTVSVSAADANGISVTKLSAQGIPGLVAQFYVDGLAILGGILTLESGRHEAWATYRNNGGRYGPACAHQVVEISTAADIAARIAALAAEPNLAAIVLTDSTVLPATASTDPVLQAHSLSALSKIQGDVTICLSQAVTGKPYDRQDLIYDVHQKLIHQDRWTGTVRQRLF